MLKINIVRGTLIVTSALVLSACQDRSMSDLRQFVDTAYQDKRPEIEPLPEIKPYEGFVYSASDSVDPFDVSNTSRKKKNSEPPASLRPNRDRRREPLEQFELDGLKMVGTISQKGVPYVIVKAPDGTAHRAKAGNYIGQNEGKILSVIEDEQVLKLLELVQNDDGQWVNREVSIAIDE